MDLKEILKHFQIEEKECSIELHGNGHINHTYAVTIEGKKKYSPAIPILIRIIALVIYCPDNT